MVYCTDAELIAAGYDKGEPDPRGPYQPGQVWGRDFYCIDGMNYEIIIRKAHDFGEPNPNHYEAHIRLSHAPRNYLYVKTTDQTIEDVEWTAKRLWEAAGCRLIATPADEVSAESLRREFSKDISDG